MKEDILVLNKRNVNVAMLCPPGVLNLELLVEQEGCLDMNVEQKPNSRLDKVRKRRRVVELRVCLLLKRRARQTRVGRQTTPAPASGIAEDRQGAKQNLPFQLAPARNGHIANLTIMHWEFELR